MVRPAERFSTALTPGPHDAGETPSGPSLAGAFEGGCWLLALGLLGYVIWLLGAR